MIFRRVVTNVLESVEELIDGMQNRLTLAENVQCRVLSVVAPDTPDSEFQVVHGLGKVPTQYIYNVDADCVVYDSRRSQWTSNVMYLKCSAATANISMTVL